jgi:putative transposase
VVAGGAADADEAATPTRSHEPASAAPADRHQSRWAYDFAFDTCADGRTLRCLAVIDEFTRECLAIDVAGVGAACLVY